MAGLVVERGGRTVLPGLDLVLAPGETILVAGRNGAGKSTLLRTLAGLLRPESGTIRYGLADEDVNGVETIHYLGYEDALKPSLTVRENLEFWVAMLGRRSGAARPNPEPVSAGIDALDRGTSVSDSRFASSGMAPSGALAAYGIAKLADLPAGYLSAGQKRRVALARLLLAPRPIWLLDEPLIALDATAQGTVVDLMAAHTARGGAVLLASHQPIAATRMLSLDAAAA